jgi:hypothetical protein
MNPFNGSAVVKERRVLLDTGCSSKAKDTKTVAISVSRCICKYEFEPYLSVTTTTSSAAERYWPL